MPGTEQDTYQRNLNRFLARQPELRPYFMRWPLWRRLWMRWTGR